MASLPEAWAQRAQSVASALSYSSLPELSTGPPESLPSGHCLFAPVLSSCLGLCMPRLPSALPLHAIAVGSINRSRQHVGCLDAVHVVEDCIPCMRH